MNSGLLSEHEAMLNLGLGAEALARFTSAFEDVQDRTEPAVTLWHLSTVLPLAFHGVSRRAISRRRVGSGLRAILARNPEHDLAQNEAIFNFNRRVRTMYPRTLRCLNCAIGWGLLAIQDGAILTTATRRPNDLLGEAKEIITAAQKLGTWAGQLSAFEYFTVLGMEPKQ